MNPPPPEMGAVLIALYDKYHWPKCIPIGIRTKMEASKKATVRNLLNQVQKIHRGQKCDHCPAPILVQSAWLVDLPRNTPVQGPLQNNSAVNARFMEPGSPLSEYVDFDSPYDANVIRVFIESTFEDIPRPPSEPTNESIRSICVSLTDTNHRVKCLPIVIRTPASVLSSATVAQFMLHVQKIHRESNCSHCPGLILVKSSFLVRILAPATTELRLLPDQLEHNPGGNVKFMQPASLMSDYLDPNAPDETGVVRLLIESTFDGEYTASKNPRNWHLNSSISSECGQRIPRKTLTAN
ncbi:hypothetical protein DFH07DRAFT_836005, partial [Mycena maculata]